MGRTGQPVQWGLQREGKKVWGEKRERKSLQRQRKGKLCVGGGDRSRSRVQSCTTCFGKGKAENSEGGLALRHMKKYI